VRYRKKPVVIEAFQIGSNRFYPDWLHDAVTANIVITHANAKTDGWKEPFDNADVKTLEGTMHAERGDWLIKGVKGEIYPCKPDIFAVSYEAATPPAVSAEPLVWESTTVGYRKFVSERRYQLFSPAVRKWYRPVCQKCATPTATSERDAVLEQAIAAIQERAASDEIFVCNAVDAIRAMKAKP
jgi:hypothetical protein